MLTTRNAWLTAILVALSLGTARGSGQEGKGAEPIARVALPDEILALANQKSRVYWREINGDFHCMYRGDTVAANAALKQFAVAGGRDVILWPGPGRYETFAGEVSPCDITLHVPGGLAMVMLRDAKTPAGAAIFEVEPTLTIHVGDADAISGLALPKGVRIVELRDLLERYRAGLKDEVKRAVADSKDAADRGARTRAATVRAQSAYQLGMLGPIADDAVSPLRDALRDPELYVRLCAVDALGRLGTAASKAIPDLEAMAKATDDAREREAATKAAEQIKAAKPSEGGDAVKARLKAIHELRLTRS